MLKLVSWNVNGLRAVRKKGFDDYLAQSGADAFCLQETKLQPDQVEPFTVPYHSYFHSAEKKGYSGTALFSKEEPLSVTFGMAHDLDSEGRIITSEYPSYYLVCAYVPNSQSEQARLPVRVEWDEAFRHYLMGLDGKKPVVLCGDLNVAHEPIDLKHPKANEGNAGYTKEERDDFTKLLSSGFVDTFRFLHPDTVAYSWWSYRFHAREHNAGWRIDYFVVSDRIKHLVKESSIDGTIIGSDHVPVILDIDL